MNQDDTVPLSDLEQEDVFKLDGKTWHIVADLGDRWLCRIVPDETYQSGMWMPAKTLAVPRSSITFAEQRGKPE